MQRCVGGDEWNARYLKISRKNTLSMRKYFVKDGNIITRERLKGGSI